MNRKSNNKQINEIRTISGELLTSPKDIANYLTNHFTEIGERLALQIPEPSDVISFETLT